MTVCLRRVALWGALVGGLIVGTTSATAAPLSGQALRIVSPVSTSLATGATVSVHVRAAHYVRSVRATLDGHRLRLRRLHRAWVAQVRSKSLRVGANSASVTAISKRGLRLRDSVTIVRPGRRVRLAKLDVPRRLSLPLRVSVRLRDPLVYFRAYLNDHRVDGLFGPPVRGLRSASLSASDGLRFGRNVLHVLAFRADGSYDSLSRTIVVPRTAPLAGAGRDAPAQVGRWLRLDGRGSLPVRRGDRLRYRWAIVRRPRGSRVRLRGPRTATPLLRPDRRGTYRVRVRVTEVRRVRTRRGKRDVVADRVLARNGTPAAGTDVVSVAAAPPIPPLGIPVNAFQTEAGRSVINIGGMSPIQLQDGYNVVVLNRASDAGGTLELITQAVFNVGDESALLNYLTGSGIQNSGYIVILDATGGATSDPQDFQSAIESIGGSPVTTTPVGNGQTWVPQTAAVGIPGTPQGSGYENFLPLNSSETFLGVNGYFTRDSTNNDVFGSDYVFAPSEYVPFTVNSSNAQIQVGCTDQTSYCQTVTPSVPTPGFGVVVLDAYTLAQVADQGFATDPTSLQNMANFLAKYSDDPSKLVFVASVDGPAPSNSNWTLVAQQIAQLGGNIHAFNTFNPPNPPNNAPGVENYALVGGAGIQAQEAVGGSDTVTLSMSGTLTRDSDWQFYPISSAPLGMFTTDLMETAYQPPTPWPYDGDDYSRVQAYIAEIFCSEPSASPCTPPPDIRSQYWQTNTTWTNEEAPLAQMHYPTHVVQITGSPTGGSFTLTWNHTTTAPIQYGTPASQVQWQLYQADPALVNVRVAGGPGSALSPNKYLIDMTAAGAGTLTANGSGLTPSGQINVVACATKQHCGVGFTPQQYSNLTTLFTGTEWPAVDNVGTLMSNLYSTFTSSSGANYADVQTISNDIQNIVGSSHTSTVDKVFATLQDVIGIASSAIGFPLASARPSAGFSTRQPPPMDGPSPNQQAGAGLGILSNAFGLASIWTTGSNGTKVLQEFQTTADELGSDAFYAVDQAQTGLERLRELLVSDYGKLTAVSDFADQYVPWNAEQIQNAQEGATVAFRQNAYNLLVPPHFLLLCGSHSSKVQGFQETVGFTGNPGSVIPTTKSYVLLAPTPLLTNIFSTPSWPPMDLDAGESAAQFWVDSVLPTTKCDL